MFFVCIQWEKLIRWRHSSKGQAQKPLYSFLSFLWTFYSGSYLQNEELSRLLNGKWTGSYIMLFYCASVLQTQTHKHTYTCTSTFSIYILLDIYSNNLGKGTDLVLLPQKKFCFVSVFVFLFFYISERVCKNLQDMQHCNIIICLLHSITLCMCFHINTSIKLTLYS